MSWTDWTLFGVFVIGFLLFLYGANTYNAAVGYTGVYLFLGSIATYLIIYIYKEITKKPTSIPTTPPFRPTKTEETPVEIPEKPTSIPTTPPFRPTKTEETPVEITKKSEETEDKLSVVEEKPVGKAKPSECSYYLGYLGERKQKEQIPDDCLVCKDVVECMRKKTND